MAKCDICGEMNKTRTINNLNICESCFEKIQKIRAGDANLIVQYLDESNYAGASSAGKEYMLMQVNHYKNEYYNSDSDLYNQQRELNNNKTADLRFKKHITTGSSLEGYNITEYLGLLQGEVVIPNGLLGAFTQGTFFTIDALTTAREQAMSILIEQAMAIKADGIIGVDIDIQDLNGRGILVSANGTAVKIQEKDDRVHSAFIPIHLVNELKSIKITSCQIDYDLISQVLKITIRGETYKRLSAFYAHAGFNTIFDESIDFGRVVFSDIVYDQINPDVFSSEYCKRIPDFYVQEMKGLLLAIEKCIIYDKIYTQEELEELSKQWENNASLSSYWDDIQNMHGAMEIYNFLNGVSIDDEIFENEILPKLQEMATIEKMYGNMKNDCISFLEKYVKEK